ncbi:MAG: hypothetical protein KF823_01405 [Xanthomonadales bacterium]|nr:hypothetical protein [Xanthomonadales bacterium]
MNSHLQPGSQTGRHGKQAPAVEIVEEGGLATTAPRAEVEHREIGW